MKHIKWQLLFGMALVILSALWYFAHYLIFHDVHHIFIYLIGDIAFVPIEVLLVTLIIHQLLDRKEKHNRLEKLNMVIGAFFSEVGTRLLTRFSDHDPDLDKIKEGLIVTGDWSDKDFSSADKHLRNYEFSVDMSQIDLVELRDFLVGKRDFMVRLLENPILLEHESFTELLRAVFHLTEELASREDVNQLPDTDIEHLAGDIKRAYTLLVNSWLDYMEHLQGNYPYLFSLAMRTNPFDMEASPVVK
ncbi:MAG: hypothetical protein KAR76_03235 [Methanosarcinales archaeon]|nr:hypothetical protein [Methanosarcinales archaeon]